MRFVSVICLLLFLATPVQSDPPSTLELDPVSVDAVRDWILQLQSMSCGRPDSGGDPEFWQIVRLGLEHAQTILQLVGDDTDTGMTVCLFGGTYAVGDVAVIAFMRLIQGVPVALFAAGGDQEKVDQSGFFAYWDYVRYSQRNRYAMREFLEGWFFENRQNLEWVRSEGSPAGGFYRVAIDEPSQTTE